jgi:hypothetical protein
MPSIRAPEGFSSSPGLADEISLQKWEVEHWQLEFIFHFSPRRIAYSLGIQLILPLLSRLMHEPPGKWAPSSRLLARPDGGETQTMPRPHRFRRRRHVGPVHALNDHGGLSIDHAVSYPAPGIVAVIPVGDESTSETVAQPVDNVSLEHLGFTIFRGYRKRLRGHPPA